MILFYVINLPISIPLLQYKSDTIEIYIFCRIYQISFFQNIKLKGKVPPPPQVYVHHDTSLMNFLLLYPRYEIGGLDNCIII